MFTNICGLKAVLLSVKIWFCFLLALLLLHNFFNIIHVNNFSIFSQRRSLPTVLSDVENPLAVVPASAPLLAAAPEPQRCRRGREVINNPGRGAETGRAVHSLTWQILTGKPSESESPPLMLGASLSDMSRKIYRPAHIVGGGGLSAYRSPSSTLKHAATVIKSVILIKSVLQIKKQKQNCGGGGEHYNYASSHEMKSKCIQYQPSRKSNLTVFHMEEVAHSWMPHDQLCHAHSYSKINMCACMYICIHLWDVNI